MRIICDNCEIFVENGELTGLNSYDITLTDQTQQADQCGKFFIVNNIIIIIIWLYENVSNYKDILRK